MIKKILFTSSTLIFSILILFFSLEILLRLFGEEPFSFSKKTIEEPQTNEDDNILGWKPKIGTFKFSPWSSDGKNTELTTTKFGRFDLYDNQSVKKIIFIGGSFTQGFAVDNFQTFSFKLQSRIKKFNIENYGVGGYGTFQSFLKLKQLLKQNDQIKFIFYGYVEHHDLRNIAQDSWLKMLYQYSKRGAIDLPFVTLDKKNLIKSDVTKYFKIPLSEYSSLIHFVEKRIMYFVSKKRYQQRHLVTNTIIKKMNEISNKNGIIFVNLFLNSSKTKVSQMKLFFEKNNIEYLDCNQENLGEKYIVKDEGHPNEKLHSIWSDCIFEYLKVD